jgi:hypothetical protein
LGVFESTLIGANESDCDVQETRAGGYYVHSTRLQSDFRFEVSAIGFAMAGFWSSRMRDPGAGARRP